MQARVVRGMDGEELDDIRSPADNERLADCITQAIREYTQDAEAALHVSIAGGRKTMGYYAGYALSLFGRPQDRLSHVLVTPGYEGNPDFFYPTPTSQKIKKPGDSDLENGLDSAEAEVTLAEIPFIRLRDDIPARLLNGQAGFSETIDAARRASEPSHLVIDRAARELSGNGVSVRLPDSLLAFYCWVVARSVMNEQPLSKPAKGEEGNREYAAEFKGHYRAVVGEQRDTDKTETALRKGMDENFFQEKISRINTALKEELGERLAQRYRIINRGRRGCTDYGLELSAGQIQII